MLTFRVLSILLSYPDEETKAGLDEMCAALRKEKLLDQKQLECLLGFFSYLRQHDLIELQENYLDLFDRRGLSLHLFEHVHGESRERGQAMVDLAQFYRDCGFEISARELPDYLPLYLEFLSLRPLAEAKNLLHQVLHVVKALGKRLHERHSPYALLLDCIGTLCPQASRLPLELISTDEGEQTMAELDLDNAEKPVDFSTAPACAGSCPLARNCGFAK